jgi:hypothetical protein
VPCCGLVTRISSSVRMLKDDIEGVEGVDLAEEYYEGAVLVIDEMAAKGGRRLGALLNALAAKDND